MKQHTPMILEECFDFPESNENGNEKNVESMILLDDDISTFEMIEINETVIDKTKKEPNNPIKFKKDSIILKEDCGPTNVYFKVPGFDIKIGYDPNRKTLTLHNKENLLFHCDLLEDSLANIVDDLAKTAIKYERDGMNRKKAAATAVRDYVKENKCDEDWQNTVYFAVFNKINNKSCDISGC